MLCLVSHVLGQALSLCSNGNIVVVIVRTGELRRTPSSVPILALAFSDLLLSLVWHVTALVQLSTGLDDSTRDLSDGEAASDGETGGNIRSEAIIFHGYVYYMGGRINE